jgi:ubiquinone/menaquinone biosynthesis C-methylase UbiE
MALGPTIRRLFGPFERDIANVYRDIFIDLSDWVEAIGLWAPHPDRILEVGCGEGAMTDRLCARYPDAEITAIDVTPRLGRLFRGDRRRVEFIQARAEEIAETRPSAFDLVILSDVLHHVPAPARDSLLEAIRRSMAPSGVFAFKEWVRDNTLIHWACEASDRYLTGDSVSYLSASEVERLLGSHFGDGALVHERRIRPWTNNMAIRVQLPA